MSMNSIVGGTAALAGGGLLAVGAVNADAAHTTWSSWTGDSDRIAEVVAQSGKVVDLSGVRFAVGDRNDAADMWKRAGLTTAVAGGVSLAAGVGALAARGSGAHAAGRVGLASAAVAGAAALVGWHSFRQLPDLEMELSRSIKVAGDNAMLDRTPALVEPRPPVWQQSQPLPQSQPMPVPDGPSPLVDPGTSAAVDPRVRVDTIEETAAKLGSFEAEFTEMAGPGNEASGVFRARLNESLDAPIPYSGAVDWSAVSRDMDTDGDGGLDYDERADTFGAMALPTYAAIAALPLPTGSGMPPTESDRLETGARLLETMTRGGIAPIGDPNLAFMADQLRQEAGVEVGPDGRTDWRAVAEQLEPRISQLQELSRASVTGG